MISQWDIFRQRDFTGGENRKILPEFLKPNQLVWAKNCVLTAEGTVQTREGKTKVNSTSLGTGGILSLFVYAKANGTDYLVVQHGTSLYASTWDGSSTIETFGTAVKTGLTASTKLRGVVWKDNLILTNGVDNPFRFDGTTCTDLSGTPPKSKIIKVYSNRLWFVDVANPNSIRISDLEDYDTWDALNVIKIRDADGDYITNLAPQAGGMVITKTKSVWSLYGNDYTDIRVVGPTADYVGCPSFDGLINEGIFAGPDNFYHFDLTSVTSVSNTHGPLFDVMAQSDKEAVFCIAHPMEQRAIFQLKTGSIAVLDGRYQGITSWGSLNASCYAIANAQGFDGSILVGDDDAGYIYKMTGDDDDGTKIETYIKTAYNDHGTPRKKVWRSVCPQIDLLDSSGQYEIYVGYDVDYENLKERTSFAGAFPDVLEWGIEEWGSAYWGNAITRIGEAYWLHGVRGGIVSFEFKTTNRIKFKGYDSKFRQAGAI